ncbi:hypothetical protein ACQY0O_005487 [Thecaphora frezii]
MDARSSDDALPSAPPEPAGAPSTSQPHSPTRDEKQAEVRDLLASLNEQYYDEFRSRLAHSFSALKLQNEDRDIISQRRIKSCRETIGGDFELIISGLSGLEPNRLPDWLARRIFITPNKKRRPIIPANDPSPNRRDIIPADDLFQVYRTWCTSHEHFDFYSALTELLNLGLQTGTTVSLEVDEKKYATRASNRSISEGKTLFTDTLIREVDDHLLKETP